MGYKKSQKKKPHTKPSPPPHPDPPSQHPAAAVPSSSSSSSQRTCPIPKFNASAKSAPGPVPNPAVVLVGECEVVYGTVTEEVLMGLLLKSMESFYMKALGKLTEMGYHPEAALDAVMKGGHAFGNGDVVTNIVENALVCLRIEEGPEEGETSEEFGQLRELEKYCTDGLVRVVGHARPELSRKDVMWCLLVSEFRVDRALAVPIPPTTMAAPSPEGGRAFPLLWYDSVPNEGEGSSCEGLPLRTKIEHTDKFNPPPAMNAMLKRNVALIVNDIRSKMSVEQLRDSAQGGSRSHPGGRIDLGGNQKNDSMDYVTEIFQNLGLGLKPEFEPVSYEMKDEIIAALTSHLTDLEKQVRERNEWALETAMNVTRKVSCHHNEVRRQRIEAQEEARVLRMEIQAAEDMSVKRHMEMQNSLRMTSAESDHVYSISNGMETEKAELKAETEATKLSASETVKSLREAERRDKKARKKLAAADKEKARILEEISEERRKDVEGRRELAEIERAIKEAEMRWIQAKREREAAEACIQEELHLKEAAIANRRRRLEILRMEADIKLQRYKDERARLDEKLCRMKRDAQNPPAEVSFAAPWVGEGISRWEATKAWLDISVDRKCILCRRDVVSVVFLPCHHQLICATCDGNKGEANCPCCGVPIEERTRVFMGGS